MDCGMTGGSEWSMLALIAGVNALLVCDHTCAGVCTILATCDMRGHTADCCGLPLGAGDDVHCVVAACEMLCSSVRPGVLVLLVVCALMPILRNSVNSLICGIVGECCGARRVEGALRALTWGDTAVWAC